MKTIQETSEKLLLALYSTYRIKGEISSDEIISFENDDGWTVSGEDSDLVNTMLEVSDNSVVALKNSLKYLYDKGLLGFKKSGLLNGDFDLYDIDLTFRGIDIIEGVTGPQTSKTIYQNTFNVKLAENINLESLISTKLGAEFKLF